MVTNVPTENPLTIHLSMTAFEEGLPDGPLQRLMWRGHPRCVQHFGHRHQLHLLGVLVSPTTNPSSAFPCTFGNYCIISCINIDSAFSSTEFRFGSSILLSRVSNRNMCNGVAESRPMLFTGGIHDTEPFPYCLKQPFIQRLNF